MVISIIVPVYNTEKYLQRCINSILAQTYVDYELLLVNDGSTDGSGNICDEYAKNDSRVKVFHKKNGGVSSARNVGLEEAQGEWVTFVDSDDWINEHFLMKMSENISSEVDLIVSSAFSDKSIDAQEFVNEMLKRSLPPQVWGKLYRRNVLKSSLQLPRDLFWGEDLVTNVLVGLGLSGRVKITSESLYVYDINESSISNNRVVSLEYEDYFLHVLQSRMGEDNVKYYEDALNYTKLYILEDLIVCKQVVDYGLTWVKELKLWGMENSKYLTLRQRIVILIRNNVICRYALAVERRLHRLIY